MRDLGLCPLLLKSRGRLVRQEFVKIVHPPRAKRCAQVRERRLGNGIQRPDKAQYGVGYGLVVGEQNVVRNHQVRGDEIVRVRRQPLLRQFVDVRPVALIPVIRHCRIVVAGRRCPCGCRKQDCNCRDYSLHARFLSDTALRPITCRTIHHRLLSQKVLRVGAQDIGT